MTEEQFVSGVSSEALTSIDFSTAATIISREIELSLSGPCPSRKSIPRSRLSPLLSSISGSLSESLGSRATAFHKALTVREATDRE